ncbi:metal ABC transporter ATP-binding protein [Nitrososphaera sp.]|uniref:metal ABC transporter ATP-binding protein n=1 Tax=Nitrososphaera sp. TaxID=1971748 RepID=UPI00307E7C13
MRAVVVELEHVSFSYGSTLVLDDISFTVEKGDLLGMIGPNGAGKTTLFSCMLGLLSGYRGAIRIFGEDIRKNTKMLRRVGYIPQRMSVERGFPATVEEVVALGITRQLKEKSEGERVASALETVGLSSLKEKRIGELSGGQQQRVLIAKAIVNEPELLILDEPATGIDVETQNKFYELLRTLNRDGEGITIIWSSHDLEAVSSLASDVACINRSMFFHGRAHEFFADPEKVRMYSESSMQQHMHDHHHHHH